MNVYEHLSYRDLFRRAIEERKRLDARVTFQAFADAIRIQKSYLSKVLKGSADFSPDQLFLACDFLALDREQRRYVSLLLELERSGLEVCRQKLQEEIDLLRKKFFDTREHLQKKTVDVTAAGLQAYYLDPLNQIVHIAAMY